MPPSGILRIRVLRQELSIHGGEMDLEKWSVGLESSLMQTFRNAERTRSGRFDGNPEAVFFADESEALGSFLNEASHGVGYRWWWKALIPAVGWEGNPGSSGSMLRVLLARPLLILPVMLRLQAWGRAALLDRLEPAAVAGLVRVSCRVHGWESLLGVLEAPMAAASDKGVAKPPASPASGNASWPPMSSLPDGDAAAPWDPPSDLPWPSRPWGRLIHGLARVHGLNPSQPSNPSFRFAFARWWQRENQGPEKAVGTASAGGQGSAAPGGPADSGGEAFRGMGNRRGPAGMRSELEQPSDPIPVSGPGHEAEVKPEAPDGPGGTRLGREDLRKEGLGRIASGPGDAGPLEPGSLTEPTGRKTGSGQAERGFAEAGAESTRKNSVAGFENGLSTKLGGVFFLLNLITSMELPECLTRQGLEHPGSWGILDLLTRILVPWERWPAGDAIDSAAACAPDPVWEALSALSGLPREGLPVRDGSGDSPLRGAGQAFHWPESWCLRWPALAVFPMPGPDTLAGHPRLANIDHEKWPWLAPVAAWSRYRLSALLALPSDPGEAWAGDSWERELFSRPGDLYLTASHLDVVFRLETTGLRTRMAGLDINPGWLPAFGKVVYFHFQ